MLVRLSQSTIARVARNLDYVPGRDFRLTYPLDLDPTDYPLGTTIVSALLVIEAEYGGLPLLTKLITTVLSASGQITDSAADGTGNLYFALTPSETNSFTGLGPIAFEVTVVDSLGRQASLDRGSLVRAVTTQGAPVFTVVVSPKPGTIGQPDMTLQMSATLYDVDSNVLLGRTIVWSSSDPTIATVDAAGLVTVFSSTTLGSTVITATAEGVSDTSTVTITPMTPAGLVAAFNALGGAGIGGTIRVILIKGINQTVVTNGASPTGYYCTYWDDAVSPGGGLHARPSPELPAGAPCLADGTICGTGLEWPASTGLSQGPQDAYDASSQTPGAPALMHRVLSDHSRGIQVGTFARPYYNSFPLYMGGGADSVVVSGDYAAGSFEPLAEGSSVTGYTDGISIVHNAFVQIKFLNSSFATSTYWLKVGRDLASLIEVFTDPVLPRRIRLNVAGGLPYSGDNGALYVAYALSGRCNAAQTKLLCDWAETQPGWGVNMWNDTRRIGWLFGDSFFALDSSFPVRIARGYNGAPHVPSFSFMNMAKGGDSLIKLQWSYLQAILGTSDFSKRADGGVIVFVSEYLNYGTPEMNFYAADYARSLSTKIRTMIHDETYNTNVNKPTGLTQIPTIKADYALHATGYIDYEADRAYQVYFGDGTTNPGTGEHPLIWGAQHPTQLWQDKRYAMTRAAFLVALGEDDSARTFRIDPSVNFVTLTAGAPTATPTWTPKSRIGTTLGGKTLTFASKLADGSSGAGIATVNASTGLITRVAVGVCAIQAVSNDGAADFLIVNCT